MLGVDILIVEFIRMPALNIIYKYSRGTSTIFFAKLVVNRSFKISSCEVTKKSTYY